MCNAIYNKFAWGECTQLADIDACDERLEKFDDECKPEITCKTFKARCPKCSKKLREGKGVREVRNEEDEVN